MTFTLDQLVYALPKAWRNETRMDAKGKDIYYPAPVVRGQCVVSSLLVQRHLGGELIRCKVGIENPIVHYFNELPNGMWLDTTRAQFSFRSPVRDIHINPSEKLYIFDDTWERVDVLEFWVQEALNDHS